MSDINHLCPKCKCRLEHDANINKEVCPQCNGIYSFEYHIDKDNRLMLVVRKWAMVTLTKKEQKELSVVAYMPQKQKQ